MAHPRGSGGPRPVRHSPQIPVARGDVRLTLPTRIEVFTAPRLLCSRSILSWEVWHADFLSHAPYRDGHDGARTAPMSIAGAPTGRRTTGEVLAPLVREGPMIASERDGTRRSRGPRPTIRPPDHQASEGHARLGCRRRTSERGRLDKSGAWRIRGAPEGPGLFAIAHKPRLRGALCASHYLLGSRCSPPRACSALRFIPSWEVWCADFLSHAPYRDGHDGARTAPMSIAGAPTGRRTTGEVLAPLVREGPLIASERDGTRRSRGPRPTIRPRRRRANNRHSDQRHGDCGAARETKQEPSWPARCGP